MDTRVSGSIDDLKESFYRLKSASNDLRHHIIRCNTANHFLAHKSITYQGDPYVLIADTLCELYRPIENGAVFPTGVLLIDDEGEFIATKLNEAKINFSAIAKSFNMKTVGARNGLRIASTRDKDVNAALSVAGGKQIWMQQCYRKVQIVNGNCTRISFTWQKNHTSRDPITIEKALSMCQFNKAKSEGKLHLWENAIRDVNPNTHKIIRIKAKADQLKANVTLGKGRHREARERLSSPTIILLNQAELPAIRFKTPDQVGTLSVARKDKINFEEFSLGFLGLYAVPL